MSTDCREKLRGSLDGLFLIYHKAVSMEGYYKVSPEDSLHLVEALRCFLCFEKTQNASVSLMLWRIKFFIDLIFLSCTIMCSMVITELPPDHAKKALEVLCLPVVTALQV